MKSVGNTTKIISMIYYSDIPIYDICYVLQYI